MAKTKKDKNEEIEETEMLALDKEPTPQERFFGFKASMLQSDLILELPDSDYFSKETGYLSKHSLEYILESPEKYKAYVDGVIEDKPTEAMEFGSALHCAVLTPSIFAKEYAVAPICDRRTKAGKEEFAAFQAENAGKKIITQEQSDKIKAMIASLRRNPVIESLLFDGCEFNSEVTILNKVELASGEIKVVKCKVDKIVPVGKTPVLIDLKTTASAHPGAFAKSCVNFRYDMQAAMYCELYDKFASDRDRKEESRFAIIAIEKEPPYACAIYFLDDWLNGGLALFCNALKRLSDAELEDWWEGYSCPRDLLPVPPWHNPMLD